MSVEVCERTNGKEADGEELWKSGMGKDRGERTREEGKVLPFWQAGQRVCQRTEWKGPTIKYGHLERGGRVTG